MPLYEYHCNDCGEEFEKMVRFSESDQPPVCPNCASVDTHKKISAFAAMGSSHPGSTSSSSCGSRGGFS